MAIRIGTSGWSYDDWDGPVYPKGIAPGERLQHYAIRFPAVEIDSTYYRDPAPGIVRGWIQKTRELEGFEFSVKAPKTLTHEALVDGGARRTGGSSAPSRAPGHGGGAPDEIARVAASWRALVADPLARAGRLGAILLQLSPGVLRHGDSLARLDVALDALKPHACAVEFRNHTWHTDAPEPAYDPDTLALLDAHNAAAVIVDGPPFPSIVAGEADHAFVRFHGRNAERWHQPARYHGDRYDYEYASAELAPWAKRLAALAKEKREVRVFFNNHVEGKAYRNGEELEAMLERERAPVAKASSPQRRLF